MDGRHDEMHSAEMRLQVHGLLAGSQLELLVEPDALIRQIGDGRDGEDGAGKIKCICNERCLGNR